MMRYGFYAAQEKKGNLMRKKSWKNGKRGDFFMKHKMSLNFGLKDESRNKQENEFRTI